MSDFLLNNLIGKFLPGLSLFVLFLVVREMPRRRVGFK